MANGHYVLFGSQAQNLTATNDRLEGPFPVVAQSRSAVIALAVDYAIDSKARDDIADAKLRRLDEAPAGS